MLLLTTEDLGALFQYKDGVSSYLTSMWASPMLRERRPVGRLSFNMGLHIPVKDDVFILKRGPGPKCPQDLSNSQHSHCYMDTGPDIQLEGIEREP